MVERYRQQQQQQQPKKLQEYIIKIYTNIERSHAYTHMQMWKKATKKNIKLFIIKDFTFNIKINVMKKQRKIIMSNDIGAVKERTAWKGRWEKLYALSDFSYGFGSASGIKS